MRTKLLLGAVLLFVLGACGGKEESSEVQDEKSMAEQRADLYQEVIAVHDEVMPRMQEVVDYKGRINVTLDSLQQIDSTSSEIENLRNLRLQLESADKAMMGWMRNFNPKKNSKEVQDNEAMQYLNEQMVAIKEVQKQMDSAIKQAEAYWSE